MSGSVGVTSGQTVAFDTIPYSILRPQTIIEVAVNYSQLGLVPFPAKMLAIGQSNGGTATPLTPVQITRPGQAVGLFGVSPLADCVEAALLNNRTTPLWAMGAPAPAAAVVATSTVTFTGATTSSGTLPFKVGDRPAPTIIAAGDSDAAQAAKFVAAVNSDPGMHVTAAANGAVVTLTTKYAGALGNSITVRYADGNTNGNLFVPGLVPLIVDPTNGAGVPDIAPVLAAVATTWFTDTALCWADGATLGDVVVESERRFAADGRLDARYYYGTDATVGQALASTDGANGRFLYTLPMVSPTPPWIVAGAYMGVCAFQLTNDPARQLKTLPLLGVTAPSEANMPIPDEQEQLLANGWGTFDKQDDGTVTLQRVVSRYLTSSDGVADGAWRDIMAAAVATRIRYDFGSYLGLVWPRAKLADDDSLAAQFDPTVATPRRLINSWAARCQLYGQLGWIESLDDTLPMTVMVRDPSDRNRVNSRLVINRVGNFMIFAGRLETEA